MTSKRISLLLAASVFLTGATGAFLGSMTPSFAITSVDELSDVNQNHWAFEALRDLVEKYDVIEGYPDGTFRGERTPTRWEMAAALNALIKAVGRDLARLGAEKADKTDLQTLARLQEQFRNELTALQARTSALEARASAIEAKNEEQDNRLTLLEKTQLHGDMSFGILSDMSSQGVSGDRASSSALLGGGVGGKDGIEDAMSVVGRLRLTMDIPVRDDQEDSKIGRGDLHTRLIAAFGRIAPVDGQGGNANVGLAGYSGYSRIAGDAANNNEGLFGGALTGGSNLRTNLYVENMHYKQHFKDGIPLLTDWFVQPDEDNWETTGDLYAGVVPWRYLYDKSPYRGNENTQFQNTSFVNIPGVAVNLNMPMVAYAWHQKLGSDDLTMDLTTGLGTIDSSDTFSGVNLTYEGRINYNTSFLGLDWDVPGSIYAGGYHMWTGGNSSAVDAATLANGGLGFNNVQGLGQNLARQRRDDASAFYTGWNQEWYKGIGTTVNYMRATGDSENLFYNSTNQTLGANVNRALVGQGAFVGATQSYISVKQSLSGVLNIPMAAVVPGWRDNDVFGVGYGIVDVRHHLAPTGTQAAFTKAWEGVVETYYRWQATESISVVPSMQLIFNRYGLQENGTTVLLGLRTNFTF